MEPVQITESVYIGELKSTELDLPALGFTHVLVALTSPPQSLEHKQITAKFLNIDDVEEQDICQYFAKSNEFIQSAVSKGKVLVVCNSGVSRSATLIAAYLMATRKWTHTAALDYLKTKRPSIGPNPGFIDQLNVYYLCGYNLSIDAKFYREWKLKQIAKYGTANPTPLYTKVDMTPTKITWRHIIPPLFASNSISIPPLDVTQVEITGISFSVTEPVSTSIKLAGSNAESIDFISKNATKATISTNSLNQILDKVATKLVTYRCKACATKLASSQSLVRHDIGPDGTCQHHFLEPVEWMRPELEKGELEGRLLCFNCQKKVGSYLWQGSRCTCGTWMTPTFKLSKSKVDEMAVKVQLK